MSTIRVFTEGERAEIKRSYENAADKKKQIGILADLHACSRLSIEIALGMKELPLPTNFPGQELKPRKKRSDAGQKRAKKETSPKNGTHSKQADNMNQEVQKYSNLTEACNKLLEQFDENEARMKEIRQQALPLVREYRVLVNQQMELVSFIENMCDLARRKE